MPPHKPTLSPDELSKLNAYWRAANYLSIGQIYLFDNPLLTEPLKPEHIKPRLLGHWGTTPGLNFIYAHCNRVIKKYDLDMIYIAGPGHGGPGVVANTYLEGTYSEFYPNIGQDVEGMKRLFTQFSFPGGIPSHVAPETPGSIHEGGELGYSLLHAHGAVFDNPNLIACCVIGDGEAETGALAASWHSNKFLNPAREALSCPSCTSMDTRSRTLRSWPVSRKRNSRSCSPAAATLRITWKATSLKRCTNSWPPPWIACSKRSTGFSNPRARPAPRPPNVRRGR